MKVAVSQILARSAAAGLLACLATSLAFAQLDPGTKLNQRSNPGLPPLSVPVLVTNGSGQPVPTTAQGTTNVAGTVNVGNTPSVNVANTPSVNVANTPTVTLSSGASVNVTSPIDGSGNHTPLAVLEAVQLYGGNCNGQFNGSAYGLCNFPTVPQGKELVIQEFDTSIVVETRNRPGRLFISGSISNINHFPYTFLVNNGSDIVAAHQETRLYVLEGVTPSCNIYLPAPSNGGYDCAISGFLVDVPLGSSPITAPPTQDRLPQRLGRNLGAR